MTIWEFIAIVGYTITVFSAGYMLGQNQSIKQ